MAKQGVVGALIAFFIGLYFAIPSQANIGYLIVDALGNSGLEPSTAIMFKGLFSLLGVVIIISDIGYIAYQFKQGNF